LSDIDSAAQRIADAIRQTVSEKAIKQVVTQKYEPVLLSDLVIADEKGRLCKLVKNPIQVELMRRLGLDPDDPKPDISEMMWRIRVLKARRQGMTTIILGLYFQNTINNPNRRSLSVAHDLEATKTLFEIVTRYHKQLPVHKKRPTARSNQRELYFEDIDSRIFIGTAGTDNLGSGGTLHNVHKSERAKWAGDMKAIRALDASIDEAARLGNIIEETTANGINYFFKDWQASERGFTEEGDKEPYVPIFFAWFDNPLYREQPPADFVRTKEEIVRVETYGIDDAQLQWYRTKKAERKELMPQEYPHTPLEAFVSTGNPVFNREVLTRWNQRLERVQAIAAPRFESVVKNQRKAWSRLRRIEPPHIKVWEEPLPENFYLVAADPAGGVNRDNKRDFCCASVWAFGLFRPLEQVAQVRGHWEPHEFAWIMAELGLWYYEATLCPLRLNHGESVWSTLVHEVKYPLNRAGGWGGLYYHNPSEISEKTTDTLPEHRTPGFPESGGGKSFMIETLQDFTDEDSIIVNSSQTVEEMFHYIQLAGGGMGGEAGSHDDTVSEAACATAIYKLRGKYARLQQKAREFVPPSSYGGYGNAYGRR
jgi:hypothetical protein